MIYNMKKNIIIILLSIICLQSSGQWVIWDNNLYYKSGDDSTFFGSHTQLDAMETIRTQVQLAKKSPSWLALAALGSPMVAETVGQNLLYSNTASNLVDGQIRYIAVYLTEPTTLTGIRVYVRTAGNYTGDNNNRIGLYSYNSSTGLLTQVAASSNTSTLWTSAANAGQTINFSSTYFAKAGLYFVALIYNQSAQTTAPGLASGVALNNAAMGSTAYGFTNSAKLYGTSTGTDLPATINMSSITASAVPTWVAIY